MTPHAHAVGSLLRPERLKRARAAGLPPYELKPIEDAAVDDAIALQLAAGLGEVTDGEMRRGHFTDPLARAVDGLGEVPDTGGPAGDPLRYTLGRVVTDRLRRRRSPALEEFVYARARAGSVPVKQTLPSPLMMQAYWSPEHSPAAYADPFDMFADAAAILRDDVRDLAALGCTSIQIDAPELALLVDPSVRESFTRRGIDPRRMLTEGVDLITSITQVPGPNYALHLCRGNKEGQWRASGGYDAIATEVFHRATGFPTLYLEYDDPRSGDFTPLRDVPDDRTVVLGLISTKHPALEPEATLLSRIKEAAQNHPQANLALSPQCGFASTEEGNPLTPEDQQAKLALVTRVAHRAWP